MNIFANLFFIFLFLLVLLFLKIPDLDYNDNYILHKVVIFVLIFCYQFLLLITNKIRKRCKIDIMETIKESLQMALYTVLGYSIFIDLKIMDSTADYVDVAMNKKGYNKVFLSSFIIGVIAIIKATGLIFTGSGSKCETY